MAVFCPFLFFLCPVDQYLSSHKTNNTRHEVRFLVLDGSGSTSSLDGCRNGSHPETHPRSEQLSNAEFLAPQRLPTRNRAPATTLFADPPAAHTEPPGFREYPSPGEPPTRRQLLLLEANSARSSPRARSTSVSANDVSRCLTSLLLVPISAAGARTAPHAAMSVLLCSWKNDPWPGWPLLLVESPVVLKRNRRISGVVRFRRFRIPDEFHEQRD
jgi:hypothetical protein